MTLLVEIACPHKDNTTKNGANLQAFVGRQLLEGRGGSSQNLFSACCMILAFHERSKLERWTVAGTPINKTGHPSAKTATVNFDSGYP
jgi:hypothetical protein